MRRFAMPETMLDVILGTSRATHQAIMELFANTTVNSACPPWRTVLTSFEGGGISVTIVIPCAGCA